MLFCSLLATIAARAGGGAATDSYEGTEPGPVSLSGFVDVYFLNNFNQPASGTNQLRAFDLVSDLPTLNYARLTLAHDPGRFG